jgi:hypothetical protein
MRLSVAGGCASIAAGKRSCFTCARLGLPFELRSTAELSAGAAAAAAAETDESRGGELGAGCVDASAEHGESPFRLAMSARRLQSCCSGGLSSATRIARSRRGTSARASGGVSRTNAHRGRAVALRAADRSVRAFPWRVGRRWRRAQPPPSPCTPSDCARDGAGRGGELGRVREFVHLERAHLRRTWVDESLWADGVVLRTYLYNTIPGPRRARQPPFDGSRGGGRGPCWLLEVIEMPQTSDTEPSFPKKLAWVVEQNCGLERRFSSLRTSTTPRFSPGQR